VNGLADLAASCQGNGSCAPLQQQSCDVFPCDVAGVACNGPCKVDGDCAAGQYCSAGVCVAKLANGATCGSPSHCTSGNCVDGVCCDDACAGDCEACDQVDHIGVCSPVVGAPRAGRPACIGSGACGGYCDGTSGSSCTLPGATTSCGIAFCASGVLTKAPACNGAATCVLPEAASCDPYRCDPAGMGCLTACSADVDCAFGLVCRNGDCAQPLPDAGVGQGSPDAGSSGGTGGARVTVDASTGAGGRSGTGGKSADAGNGGKGTGGVATGGSSSTGTEVSGPDAGFSTSADSGTGKPSGSRRARDAGGCGCRVEPARADLRVHLAALAVGMLALARRRRRREPIRPRPGT
jgi:MYXO-CTERM domain-containing protein